MRISVVFSPSFLFGEARKGNVYPGLGYAKDRAIALDYTNTG